MNEHQKRVLRDIVEVVEESGGRRVILDYVMQLVDAPMAEKDAFLEAEFAKYPTP